MTRLLRSLVLLAIVAGAYGAIRAKRGALTDFAVPRTAAARFLAHEPLYRPEDGHYQFKYLPAFAAVMVPFAWLPKPAAEAVWFALLVGMAAAFAGWACRAVPERRLAVSQLLWLTLLLNAKFLLKELGFGQFDLPLALLFWGAVAAARDRRAALAGALIAASVFVKPYAIVLLPWLVWTQPRRSLVPFAAVAAIGLALPAVTYGWNGNVDLLDGWYRTVTGTTAPNLASNENISFVALWTRWLPAGSPAGLVALASAAVAMIAGLDMLRRRGLVAEPNYLEGAYFAALIPLLSPQGWDYLMLLALPGYACLVDRWRDTPLPWRTVTAIGFLLTSFASYEVMRRTVYFHVMAWGGGSVGAVLIAIALLRLRWRALA